MTLRRAPRTPAVLNAMRLRAPNPAPSVDVDVDPRGLGPSPGTLGHRDALSLGIAACIRQDHGMSALRGCDGAIG